MRGLRWAGPCLAVLAACASPAPVSAPLLRVQHVGVLREVMHAGRTEARAILADHTHPGTFGVGAMTGLDGEILIDDGVPWVAIEAAMARRAPAAASATLLTTAVVAAWGTIAIDESLDLGGLETLLAAKAPAGTGLGSGLPFVLEGRGAVQLHVMRGACPHGVVPAGKEPVRFSADDAQLRLVGFFVAGEEGIVTPMGSSLHVHAFATVGDGPRVLGHVEQVTLAPGARLSLPALSR